MLEILIFGLVVFAVICLWVLIEERKSPKFLIWFIPLFLVLVTSTYLTYTSILGFPKEGIPSKDYISNIIMMNQIGFTYGCWVKIIFQWDIN